MRVQQATHHDKAVAEELRSSQSAQENDRVHPASFGSPQTPLPLPSEGTSHMASPDHQASIGDLSLPAFEGQNSVVVSEHPLDWQQLDLLHPPIIEIQGSTGSPSDPGNSISGLEKDHLAAAIDFQSHEEHQHIDASMDWLAHPTDQSLLIPESVSGNGQLGTSNSIRDSWKLSGFPDLTFFEQSSRTLRRPWLGHWPTSISGEALDYNEAFTSSLFGLSAHPMQLMKPYAHTELDPTNPGIEDGESARCDVPNPQISPQAQTLPARPPWLCFPISMSPPMSSDARLQAFVQQYSEARGQGVNQRLRRPSLLSFLVDSPDEPLSDAVKQYLSPLKGSMELPELLASYWIISLVVRVSLFLW